VKKNPYREYLPPPFGRQSPEAESNAWFIYTMLDVKL
jgi:hypothetical protein